MPVSLFVRWVRSILNHPKDFYYVTELLQTIRVIISIWPSLFVLYFIPLCVTMSLFVQDRGIYSEFQANLPG